MLGVVIFVINLFNAQAITVSPLNPIKGDTVTLTASVTGFSITWTKDSNPLTSCVVSAAVCTTPTPPSIPNSVISVNSGTSESTIVMTDVNQTLNGGSYDVTGASVANVIIHSLPTTVEWKSQPNNNTKVSDGTWKAELPCVFPPASINVEFDVYIEGNKETMNSSSEDVESDLGCESTENTVIATINLSGSKFQDKDVYIIARAWHTLFPGQEITSSQSNQVTFTGSETTTEEPRSTTEQSTMGSSFMLTASYQFTTIGSGHTLATHLTPTSDVGRSSLVVPTDGRIHSLNTISNSPDETMTFSSIFLAITHTSSLLFQTSASLDISPYNIYDTYTPTYLMSTLTTNIFGSSIPLTLSSSRSYSGHYSESSLKSFFDTKTSDLSKFSHNSVLYNSFRTIDAFESSNFISVSKIYSVDSITGLTFTISNRISSFVNSAYMSGLKILTSISLSDSLTQDLQSQIATSPNGIVTTQKETGSHIDHTQLISFKSTDNLQLSLEISHQPSLSPSVASHLAKLSTQTFLCNHSMKSEESLTIQTTLSNLDKNSIFLTTFTPDGTSTSYLSSGYTSVDFESAFDSNTKNGRIGTSTIKVIETLALNSIAESHETKIAKISMNDDLSSNMLINSPITSFGSTLGTLIVRPTVVEINTSMDSFFETFEDKASTLSVNFLQTRSLSESETVGIVMSTSVETSNEYGIESDSLYNAISSGTSELFDSFSVLPEKDSENVLSTTPDVVVWSSVVSRISLGRLSPIGSSSYISTKHISSIYVNSDKYSLATNTRLSQPKDFVSTILPSVSKYFYSSDIKTASSSLLVSSSVNEHSVITYSPSLNKSSKVIAISVTVVGCILFVAITILVLFFLKLLQCKPRSKVSKANKKFSNTNSNRLSINTRRRCGINLFDQPYGLPTRYYDKTATSWGVNDNQFTCTYNKSWDDIT